MATLAISNRKRFDEEVWQSEMHFNEGQYNEWMKTASDSLVRLYTTMTDTNINVDVEDLCFLSDVINMLNVTKIKIIGR